MMLNFPPFVLQERLQKCYEKSPPALEDGIEVDPALLLRTLQVCFMSVPKIAFMLSVTAISQ